MSASSPFVTGPMMDQPDISPDGDVFYAALTARNRGLVSGEEQQLLRRAVILVAGCGSIGGAVVEPLVRMGAERLVLAEPDDYELHNLNRQHAGLADVGRNKASVLADWVAGVNPHAQVRVDTRCVTADNVAGGKVGERDLAAIEPLAFLARVVPLRALPVEIFPELRRQQSEPGRSFPQLVYSARMFGVLAPRLALDLLTGRPVRRRVLIDVHDLPRPAGARWRATLARIAALARMVPTALAYRR
jgi:hypothetical protein